MKTDCPLPNARASALRRLRASAILVVDNIRVSVLLRLVRKTCDSRSAFPTYMALATRITGMGRQNSSCKLSNVQIGTRTRNFSQAVNTMERGKELEHECDFDWDLNW